MNLKTILAKFFTKNNEAEEIALHISGAVVRHQNPFQHIEVPLSEEELTEEFIDRWVLPFYMVSLSSLDEELIRTFANSAREIDPNVVYKLLSEFNWRTRITGAFFAAINNYTEFEDIIGKHLLKSEVCYAGAGYCLALAIFGTDNSKNYLRTYLHYYLDRRDLWFDQPQAFCALEYLDINAANELKEKWQTFSGDKSGSLEKSREYFLESIASLEKIKAAISNTLAQ